jgi:hypothetical protein
VLHCRACDEQWLVPFSFDDPSEPAAVWMLCPNGCNADPIRPGDKRKIALAVEIMSDELVRQLLQQREPKFENDTDTGG